jgi:hypothetical protein
MTTKQGGMEGVKDFLPKVGGGTNIYFPFEAQDASFQSEVVVTACIDGQFLYSL